MRILRYICVVKNKKVFFVWPVNKDTTKLLYKANFTFTRPDINKKSI